MNSDRFFFIEDDDLEDFLDFEKSCDQTVYTLHAINFVMHSYKTYPHI